MKPWYLTSEAYAALVPAIFGLLGTCGLLAPEKATELQKAVLTLVSALLVVIPPSVYMKTRTDLKAAVAMSASGTAEPVADLTQRLKLARI